MPRLVETPSIIPAAGNKPKQIEEFVGRVNTDDEQLSVARMKSPSGWIEPGQTPMFREITIVLNGALRVQSNNGDMWVREGQAVVCEPGEWVRYSSPEPAGAEYIAICLPAFSLDGVRRDPPG